MWKPPRFGLHATPMVIKDVIVVGAAHAAGDVPRPAGTRRAMSGASMSSPASACGFSTPSRARANMAMTAGSAGDADEAGNTGVWAQMFGR